MIITNNERVQEKYSHVRFVTGSVLDVFIATRDEIHKGRKLLTHPLSGSVKPNETRYKSIALSEELGPLDVESLLLIEDAIQLTSRMEKERFVRHLDESLKDDFRMIDLSLLESSK
ncbi:GrdX family protein [Guggenheimella bovis]